MAEESMHVLLTVAAEIKFVPAADKSERVCDPLYAMGELTVLQPESGDEVIVLNHTSSAWQYAVHHGVPLLALPKARTFVLPSAPPTASATSDPKDWGEFALVLADSVSDEDVAAFTDIVAAFGSVRFQPPGSSPATHRGADGEELFQDATSDTLSIVEMEDEGEGEEAPGGTWKLVSEGITKGGAKVAQGVAYTSNALTSAIQSGSAYVVKNTGSRGDVEMSESTVRRAKRAKRATDTCVKVSRSMVDAAVSASSRVLGAAAHVAGKTSVGQKLEKKAAEPSGGVEALKASVLAAVAIADALDDAAIAVLKAAGQGTEDIVKHRYGLEAADTAHDVASSVTDVGRVYVTTKKLGWRALAKRTIKTTSVQLMRRKEDDMPEGDKAALNA